jgi:hypothetical protein
MIMPGRSWVAGMAIAERSPYIIELIEGWPKAQAATKLPGVG